jgi:hypothetical protein
MRATILATLFVACGAYSGYARARTLASRRRGVEDSSMTWWKHARGTSCFTPTMSFSLRGRDEKALQSRR